MSPDSTCSVKGIFILLVFISHFNGYVTYTAYTDQLAYKVIYTFGQTMVTLFMLYSGYGVMESVKKKGSAYIRGMPLKRIGATLFQYICAVLLYLLLGEVKVRSVWHFLQMLVGWESAGNSNWYIFTILVLYLLTWIVFQICSERHPVLASCLIFVAVGALTLGCMRYEWRPSWWYDTAVCYCIGMFWSLWRSRIEVPLRKSRLLYLLALAAALGACAVFRFCDLGFAGILALHAVFALTVVLITMRFRLGNRVLHWCGDHLFELYILQRIPMILLKRAGLAEWNIYLYFACSLAVTVLLAIPFRFVVRKAWRLIAPGAF